MGGETQQAGGKGEEGEEEDEGRQREENGPCIAMLPT
jgi:hypothetical protein